MTFRIFVVALTGNKAISVISAIIASIANAISVGLLHGAAYTVITCAIVATFFITVSPSFLFTIIVVGAIVAISIIAERVGLLLFTIIAVIIAVVVTSAILYIVRLLDFAAIII